jgi:group II intron reverse transcriptase/maturase
MAPEMAFTTLAHHVDRDLLLEAYRRTRKDGAVGIDAVSAEDYEKCLDANIDSLLSRFKSGTYRAPPVKRGWIPKGDGKEVRPIGIPTFEDKVLQRAVTMVLEEVFEQDFLPCSWGFRRGRSQHGALAQLRRCVMAMGGGWVIDLDVSKFFDTLVHRHLWKFIGQRVQDGVMRRMIGKWLKAGVLEDGVWSRPEDGTPQGGVISPLLANIYLHVVLDTWFENEVKPCLRGQAHLVRFADDAVIVVSNEMDARRLMEVLPKRMGRFGLTVHPEKTKLVPFRHPSSSAKEKPGTFNFLGFTHYWGKTRQGGWMMKVRTAKDRMKRALKRVNDWCRRNRHLPVGDQSRELGRKISGHCQYYGLTGNSAALQTYAWKVTCIWHKWLDRRSQRPLRWSRFLKMLEAYPLPNARCVHSVSRLQ